MYFLHRFVCREHTEADLFCLPCESRSGLALVDILPYVGKPTKKLTKISIRRRILLHLYSTKFTRRASNVSMHPAHFVLVKASLLTCPIQT